MQSYTVSTCLYIYSLKRFEFLMIRLCGTSRSPYSDMGIICGFSDLKADKLNAVTNLSHYLVYNHGVVNDCTFIDSVPSTAQKKKKKLQMRKMPQWTDKGDVLYCKANLCNFMVHCSCVPGTVKKCSTGKETKQQTKTVIQWALE